MTYEQIINGIKRFGITEREICNFGIWLNPEQVHKNIVLAPMWEPSELPGLGKAEYLMETEAASMKVWNITSDNYEFLYIKTGIGASLIMDAVLTLGVTRCRNIIFIGSVGALDDNMKIGDIVIPEYSICGDGASRYIASESLNEDIFGEKVYPDPELTAAVTESTRELCSEMQVGFHIGRTFSVDTITAQYAHLDQIFNLGCNTIEMETAAAFRAAKMAGIHIAAVFSISDNTMSKKSLVCGITEKDMQYRENVIQNIFPQMIKQTFQDR